MNRWIILRENGPLQQSKYANNIRLFGTFLFEQKGRRRDPSVLIKDNVCQECLNKKKRKWLKLLTLLLSVALTDAVKATDSKKLSVVLTDAVKATDTN